MDDDMRAEFDGALQIRTQNVLSTTTVRLRSLPIGNRGDVCDAHGWVAGVSRYSILVLGRKALRTKSGTAVSTKLNSRPKWTRVVWRAEYAAVNGFGQDHMVARAQQAKDRVNSRHAGRKNISAVAAFQLGNGAFKSFAVRVISARVIVPFVLAQFLIDVRGGLIDRCDDGSGGGIGLLPDMNGVVAKPIVLSLRPLFGSLLPSV